MSTTTPWASVEVRLLPNDPSQITDESQRTELFEAIAYELAAHPDIGGVEIRDASTGLISPMSITPGTEATVALADQDLAKFGQWLGSDPGLIIFTTPAGLESAGATATEVAASYGFSAQAHAQIHSDDRWRDAWKEFYRPMLIGERLRIRPSWHPRTVNDDLPELVLDPGRAFGTGLHETTRLCLDALAYAATQGKAFKTCLDLGCGSGILGLAALRLFAATLQHCTLIDNDIEAIEATVENLAHNQIAQGLATAQVGSDQSLNAATYDLVLANIRPSVLIPAADEIAARVAHGGWLMLSGILDEEAQEVADAYANLGLHLEGQPSVGGWSALIWHRPS